MVKEIKGLINDSVDKVNEGLCLVNELGLIFKEIVEVVVRVLDLIV